MKGIIFQCDANVGFIMEQTTIKHKENEKDNSFNLIGNEGNTK